MEYVLAYRNRVSWAKDAPLVDVLSSIQETLGSFPRSSPTKKASFIYFFK